MRVLLLGKDGQLGRELQRSLAPLGELVAWGRNECDLSQTESLYAKVLAVKPDVIVNAAAYTAVDKAESEPELAHAINATAPAVLAQATSDMACRLIHYSTDYVFNGSGSTPWLEDSPTAPLNVYGKAKLAGEQAIAASGCKHLIFRTSWVYAREGGNFAKTMLRLASERDALSVIDDQIGAPTDAAWLADMTAQVIVANNWGLTPITETSEAQDRRLVSDPNYLFHAASAGEVSWHGYASYLIARAREMGFPINVLPEAIRAVASEAFPMPAQRPRNSRLDCSKLTATFGIHPPRWQDGIDKLLQHLKP
jgi:dTDP-4-dehydrorhamnose reductase